MPDTYLGEDLVFLISQPRSGSTLLQRVLSGHPEIQTSAETWLMLHPVYALRPEKVLVEYDSKNAAIGVQDFLDYYTDGIEVHDNATRQWAATLYRNALDRGSKRFFLDKTPRYFFIIPDLYRLFPRAKFIFLLRNPLAVLSSLLATYVKEDWPKLSFFRPDLIQAPRMILEGIRSLGDKAIVIRYEEFVSDPENNIERLCDRMGITFHDEMLDYARTEKPAGRLNDPVGVQQHTRPSTSSLEKWRKLGESRQGAYFAASYLEALGPEVISALGYPHEELSRLFPLSSIDRKDRDIFPFDIAMKPRKEWTFREWLRAERYFSVRRKGSPRGELSALKRGFFHGMKLLTQQLGRPDSARKNQGG